MDGNYESLALPAGSAEVYVTGERGPGVLMYMDAFGLRPQLERMADRIASWGHVVLTPNLFWRNGSIDELAPRIDLLVPENRASFFASGAMARIRALTAEQSDGDTDVWLDALRARPGVQDGPVAVIGYCFGGRLALRAAARHPDDVALVGLFHTGGIVTDAPDSPHLLVPHLSGYVLAGHADHDRSNTPEQIAAFDEALTAAGVPHRTAVYPGAEHGYTMADTSSYQEEGAERHFTELREAFERTFRGSGGRP